MDILKKSRNFIGLQMKDQMIKNSVFAGVVFIIIAHPQTFKLVDSVIKVHNKNLLLLVHAVVVSLIMYFGSLYLFNPFEKVLLEGMSKDLKKVSIMEAINCVNKTNNISNEKKDPEPSNSKEDPEPSKSKNDKFDAFMDAFEENFKKDK